MLNLLMFGSESDQLLQTTELNGEYFLCTF